MKTEIKILQPQQETNTTDVSQSDANSLLAKYGFTSHTQTTNPQHTQTTNPQHTQTTNDLTFEEMVRQKEIEDRRDREEKWKKMNAPKSITFDNKNVNYTETKWSSLDIDDNSFGIKIQIVTDMKI